MFAGDVFLPARLLGHVEPWKASGLYPDLPPWNPLRWDGIGQFYPWRKFAADTLRSGYLPLWNPYQFCGTPFVANSQSAVFYPANLLFVLIPDAAYAFGWSAVLHLTLCGWFAYLLLRRLRCSEIASLVGGVVFAFSAWQVAWLQLPTFLATSCWFPLLLRQIYASVDRQSSAGKAAAPRVAHTHSTSSAAPSAPSSNVSMDRNSSSTESCPEGALGRRPPSEAVHGVGRLAVHGVAGTYEQIGIACGIGLVVGLMLLAGHLQIALYGLVAGASFAIGLLVVRRAPISRVLVWCGGLGLGLMLALPQLLPAVELSRMSHRVGKPSAAGLKSYTNYAVPAAGLVQTMLPSFFGGDKDPANPYWGYYRMRSPAGQEFAVYHNPAETAIYVGILPLVLAMFACARGFRCRNLDRRVVFFAVLALLALLLALGTPVNAVFYYGIPGFAQSGSPARCLVLWALAISALAALGIDHLAKEHATRREIAIVFGALAVAGAVCLKLAIQASRVTLPGLPQQMPALGQLFVRTQMDWVGLAIFLLAGAVLLSGVAPGKRAEQARETRKSFKALAIPATLLLVVVDLFWSGINANPTARREQVYPETKGIGFLREHAGHNRIFPLNQQWSLFASDPHFKLHDVLPPNAATVYGLRDVQGYDSLFYGRYKAFANGFARQNHGVLDASPVEVGNIVFFQDANAPGVPDTAAAYAIAVPADLWAREFPGEAVPPVTPLDTGDAGMIVYELPNGGGRASLVPHAAGSTIDWLEDGPTRVTLSIATPLAAALSLHDSAMPGWRLRIDGKPVPIAVRQDSPVVRFAPVAAGRHAAAFRYEPASFRVGLFAACAALLALALAGGLSVGTMLGWRR